VTALRDFSPDASGKGVGDAAPLVPGVTGYYDQPLLKRPHWEASVKIYLFLGGLMGGSGLLAMIAGDATPERAKVARNARYTSIVLALICPPVLISHLGRPERFLNMLRVFKTKSVMNMGVWGLIGFSAFAGAGAVGQLARDGVLVPRWMRVFGPTWVVNVPLGVFGAFISGYTGVLLSATAIPTWGVGKRHIPAFSLCSGVAGASALGNAILALEGGNERMRHKLAALERVAAAAEFILLQHFRVHAGPELAAPMYTGTSGKKLSTLTMAIGILGANAVELLPITSKWKTVLSTAMTLVGAYNLRDVLIEAGKDSADDPKAAFRQPE
jgi:formate-dependent nitrite reductase membrane component NrfD